MGDLILNSLEVRDFQAFRDLKIDQLGRVNLLVGKNNVGKTSLLEAIRLQASNTSIPCIFIPSQKLSGQRLIELWDGIAMTNLEEEVLAALRLIASGLVDLNFVSTPLSGGDRIPVVKITGSEEPLPLYSLGEGMLRALGISLALVNAKDGILLIDEFENGLYYTVQPDIWKLIFRVARRLLTTSGAYSLLAMIQQIGDWRNLSEKIVQWEGVALPAASSTPLKRRIFWRNLYLARRS